MALDNYFPAQIRALPEFKGRFEAFKLEAKNCDVLFASYPAGTKIEARWRNPTHRSG